MRARWVARLLVASVACFLILAVFVPIDPLMPESSSDMSWMMAMNQAVAQHLVFGRDIVFTFGPYASVYSEVFHPATDRLMLSGSLLLGLGCFALLWLLGRGAKSYAVVLFAFILAAIVNSRDALLLSYPLLLSLVVSGLVLPEDHPMRLRQGRIPEAVLALLFAPLGLLCVVKVSLLPVCGITSALCGLLLWHRGRKVLALAGPGVAAAAMMLLWAAAGQPVSAIPQYIARAIPMITGYTEAMALQGNAWEWIAYVLSAVILIAVLGVDRSPRISRMFLILSYAMFLFLAFKIGFVRHNPWHNVTASSSILIAASLMVFAVPLRRALPALVLAGLACALISEGSIQNAAQNASLNLRVAVERAFAGVGKRFTPQALQRDYDRHLASIQTQFPIDHIDGTTDFYSMNQSWLFAARDRWAPRPVLQSYSAYTPELAALNLQYLNSPQAPDNIIFRVEPIDNRLPSLEDGPSWPAILENYSLLKLGSQVAYLQKHAGTAQPPHFMPIDLNRTTYRFGEQVPVPEAPGAIFAKLDIRATLPGRALSLAYKPPQLQITLRLRSGEELKLRAVSSMMKSEFLLSPLVKNTEEFARLVSGKMESLAGNEVRSFEITTDDSTGLLWNPAYALTFSRLDRGAAF